VPIGSMSFRTPGRAGSASRSRPAYRGSVRPPRAAGRRAEAGRRRSRTGWPPDSPRIRCRADRLPPGEDELGFGVRHVGGSSRAAWTRTLVAPRRGLPDTPRTRRCDPVLTGATLTSASRISSTRAGAVRVRAWVVTVQARANGPYLITGDVALIDSEGRPFLRL